MAEDHGAPETGQLARAGPGVIERQRVAKERAAQRVRSLTVRNEMKGIQGRVSAGAAGRICLSWLIFVPLGLSNTCKTWICSACCRKDLFILADLRTAGVVSKTHEGTCVSKNFD